MLDRSICPYVPRKMLFFKSSWLFLKLTRKESRTRFCKGQQWADKMSEADEDNMSAYHQTTANTFQVNSLSSPKRTVFYRTTLRKKKRREQRHERQNKVWKLTSPLMGVLSGCLRGRCMSGWGTSLPLFFMLLHASLHWTEQGEGPLRPQSLLAYVLAQCVTF